MYFSSLKVVTRFMMKGCGSFDNVNSISFSDMICSTCAWNEEDDADETSCHVESILSMRAWTFTSSQTPKLTCWNRITAAFLSILIAHLRPEAWWVAKRTRPNEPVPSVTPTSKSPIEHCPSIRPDSSWKTWTGCVRREYRGGCFNDELVIYTLNIPCYLVAF